MTTMTVEEAYEKHLWETGRLYFRKFKVLNIEAHAIMGWNVSVSEKDGTLWLPNGKQITLIDTTPAPDASELEALRSRVHELEDLWIQVADAILDIDTDILTPDEALLAFKAMKSVVANALKGQDHD